MIFNGPLIQSFSKDGSNIMMSLIFALYVHADMNRKYCTTIIKNIHDVMKLMQCNYINRISFFFV